MTPQKQRGGGGKGRGVKEEGGLGGGGDGSGRWGALNTRRLGAAGLVLETLLGILKKQVWSS